MMIMIMIIIIIIINSTVIKILVGYTGLFKPKIV